MDTKNSNISFLQAEPNMFFSFGSCPRTQKRQRPTSIRHIRTVESGIKHGHGHTRGYIFILSPGKSPVAIEHPPSSIQKLVGGLNPSEKYQSIGIIIPNIWENKIDVPNHQPVEKIKIIPLNPIIIPISSHLLSRYLHETPEGTLNFMLNPQ